MVWVNEPQQEMRPQGVRFLPDHYPNLVLWLYGGPGRIYEEISSPTVLSLDGQPAGTWTDKTSGGYDLNLGHADDRGEFTLNDANWNGYSSVKFNGVDQYLRYVDAGLFTAMGFTVASGFPPMTYYFLAKHLTASDVADFDGPLRTRTHGLNPVVGWNYDGSASNEQQRVGMRVSSVFESHRWGETLLDTDTDARLVVVCVDNDDMWTATNNEEEEETSVDMGDSGPAHDVFEMACGEARVTEPTKPGSFVDISVPEVVIFADSHTAAQVATMRNYFNNKYKLNLTALTGPTF